KDYIKVYTKNGMMITKQFISTTEAMLPENEFVRCHRSYIVSLKHVRSFTNELLEIGKTQIPIGKLFRNEVMKALG
ncbi:MAG: LytTR family transcriptional regulator, partial [Bacteroidetes bacterium]|nr:LytTR family transcriptional regulator [Bacteroidota bacterium]